MNPLAVAAATFTTPLLGAVVGFAAAVFFGRAARSRSWIEGAVRASPFETDAASLRQTMNIGALLRFRASTPGARV